MAVSRQEGLERGELVYSKLIRDGFVLSEKMNLGKMG